MQLIVATTAFFASAVLAVPQWRRPGPPPSPPSRFGPDRFGPDPWYPPGPPYIPPGRGGNEEGRYHGGCGCSVAGQFNPDIGQFACNNLGFDYPNLYWDGIACVDANGLGVEQNGYTRACQDVARQFFPDAFGFDFVGLVYADCTFF